MKEKALPDIENYMFEDHDQIRQAATECMCNLVTCKEVRMDKQLKISHNNGSCIVSACVNLFTNGCGLTENLNSVCFRSKIVTWKMAMIR